MIQIPLNVDVECKDGPAGKSTAVIVNRETLHPTHFVVKEKNSPHTEHLVPTDYIEATATDSIRLSCTLDLLQRMDQFVTTSYHTVELMRYSGTGYGTSPFYTPEITTFEHQSENVPVGAVSIRSGKDVQVSDGKVGRIVNLVEDPDSGQITHFVMHEAHLWGGKDLIVPVSMVSYVDDEAIHLKIDKQTISAMLAVPTREFKDLTKTLFVSVTFPEAGKAKDFLDLLQKYTNLEFFNAAVLVKESDGKTSLREIHDVDKRHGAVFGAITGGLVGLLGGPAGAIIGAAAGAATGRAAAKRIDLGLPDEFLKQLQAGLQPGSSMLVVLLAQEQTSKMVEAAANHGGQYLEQELTQDILAQIPVIDEEREP